eukprot:TRINITY_DN4219_c0_g1_i1.p3 TRINITY_DN4219_c0_g1~~TRINITY_DN4219_c0_g1_i1.p3  ORF type:complete len:132 (-),score=28.36 TRINITY_DN4219_c0_g1_i1:301-696(-)
MFVCCSGLFDVLVQLVIGGQFILGLAMGLFFFFSSRRRHTRCREVSWARRCVQETGINAEYMGERAKLQALEVPGRRDRKHLTQTQTLQTEKNQTEKNEESQKKIQLLLSNTRQEARPGHLKSLQCISILQ